MEEIGFSAADVGAALARIRREVGMTQTEVAERMGSTQSAVSRAERGRVLPGIDFIDRFSKAVGRPFLLDLGRPRRPREGSGLRVPSIRPAHTRRTAMHFTPSELWEMRKLAREPKPAAAAAGGASGRSWDEWVAEGRI